MAPEAAAVLRESNSIDTAQAGREAGKASAAGAEHAAAEGLTGTCEFMCPTDELAQRTRIGDIAMFERIDPHVAAINTALAVKKFARNVRPPSCSSVLCKP